MSARGRGNEIRKRGAEPIRCTCEGGADRAREHAKRNFRTARHFSSCPHSQLEETTRPAPKRVWVKNITRLVLEGPPR